jgi:O-antigen/teichoic acid export membrane protein
MNKAVESTPKPSSRKGFASDVLKLTSAATLAQALGVLTSPIVSRLYGPKAYGVTNLFTSITGIFGVIACMRYEHSIMLPDKDEEAVNLLSVSLLFSLIVSLVAALVSLSGKELILQWLDEPLLERYIWLVPLSVLASGIFLSLSYWVSRAKRYGSLSIARIVRSISNALILIGAGLLGYATADGKIGAIIISQAIAILVLGGVVWHNDAHIFRRYIRLSDMWSGIKRYRKFPLYNIWAALLNNISWQLPTFMLSKFFSSTVVGYYGLGNRVLRMPMNLIGQALAQVFFQRASSANSEGVLSILVENIFRTLVKLGMLPSVLLAIIGQDLFTVVFGAQWSEAGVYTQILAIWTFFWFISSPMGTLYSVLEKQEFSLILNIFIFFTRLASLAIGGMLKSARIALLLFGASGIIVYGYLNLSIMHLAGIPLHTIFKILLSNFLSLLPMIAVLVFLKVINVNSFVVLLISSLFAALYLFFIVRDDLQIRRLLDDKVYKFK